MMVEVLAAELETAMVGSEVEEVPAEARELDE
jgi:hypothetical protein